MADNELFTDNPAPADPNPGEGNDGAPESFVDQYVGEGKKYKDVEELAKALHHANDHIKKVESEQAELRQDLNTRLTLEEVMDQLAQEGKSGTSNQGNQPDEPNNRNSQRGQEAEDNANTKQGLSQEEISKLVSEELQQFESQRQQADNLEHVRSEAEKALGPNYQSELTNKAKELNLGQEFLANLAKTQPNAFLKLMVEDQKKGGEGGSDSAPTTPPHSQINSDAMGSANRSAGKTYGYYQKLRRENPREYWSPEVQNEIHSLAIEYAQRGEDFTKT